MLPPTLGRDTFMCGANQPANTRDADSAKRESPPLQETAENAVVHVQNFDFRFDPGMPWVLKDVNLTCSKGSRTLLIGDDSNCTPPALGLKHPNPFDPRGAPHQ